MKKQCCGDCSVENFAQVDLSQSGVCDSGKEVAGFVSEFLVPKMDCPSEEHLIRMALADVRPPAALVFDTPNRRVTVTHGENIHDIQRRLDAVGLGARLEASRTIDADGLSAALMEDKDDDARESATLKWLLLINGFMFVVELSLGWLAQSTGLIADSLDMFADAAVYGVALYAVGHSARIKMRAAHLSGWLQLLLALGALGEVLRRLVFGSEPLSALMMGMGAIALAANIACLVLIHSQRDRGVHMKASWIFSANDVIANLGVILAGLLVGWTGSRYPDLFIGVLIGLLVLGGARRILSLQY